MRNTIKTGDVVGREELPDNTIFFVENDLNNYYYKADGEIFKATPFGRYEKLYKDTLTPEEQEALKTATRFKIYAVLKEDDRLSQLPSSMERVR